MDEKKAPDSSGGGETPPFEPTIADSASGEGLGSEFGPTLADSSMGAEVDAHQYEVVRPIGAGGMGSVHLAWDARLRRWVALKRLSSEFLDHARLRKRFAIEARAIAALSHFHIVHVYAFGEDQAGPYIAMEYVAGPAESRGDETWPAELPRPPLSLEAHVKSQGPLGVDEARELGQKLCRALKYAHGRSVIHRDVKPSNILLDDEGEPKLADFGLARRTDAMAEGLTIAGAQLLSLGYGAPEQEIDASSVDHRADIYGLGATLWFALTGESPRFFRESTVPDDLRPALSKALERDRELRHQDAGELLAALEEAARPVQATPAVAAAGYWHCVECGHPNPDATRFCVGCGDDALRACSACGSQVRKGQRHCGRCGRPTADARPAPPGAQGESLPTGLAQARPRMIRCPDCQASIPADKACPHCDPGRPEAVLAKKYWATATTSVRERKLRLALQALDLLLRLAERGGLEGTTISPAKVKELRDRCGESQAEARKCLEAGIQSVKSGLYRDAESSFRQAAKLDADLEQESVRNIGAVQPGIDEETYLALLDAAERSCDHDQRGEALVLVQRAEALRRATNSLLHTDKQREMDCLALIRRRRKVSEGATPPAHSPRRRRKWVRWLVLELAVVGALFLWRPWSDPAEDRTAAAADEFVTGAIKHAEVAVGALDKLAALAERGGLDGEESSVLGCLHGLVDSDPRLLSVTVAADAGGSLQVSRTGDGWLATQVKGGPESKAEVRKVRWQTSLDEARVESSAGAFDVRTRDWYRHGAKVRITSAVPGAQVAWTSPFRHLPTKALGIDACTSHRTLDGRRFILAVMLDIGQLRPLAVKVATSESVRLYAFGELSLLAWSHGAPTVPSHKGTISGDEFLADQLPSVGLKPLRALAATHPKGTYSQPGVTYRIVNRDTVRRSCFPFDVVAIKDD